MCLEFPYDSPVSEIGSFYKVFEITKEKEHGDNYLTSPFRSRHNAYKVGIIYDAWEGVPLHLLNDYQLKYTHAFENEQQTYLSGFHGYKNLEDAIELYNELNDVYGDNNFFIYKCRYYGYLAQDRTVIVARYMELLNKIEEEKLCA